jgi:hypothetical protein
MPNCKHCGSRIEKFNKDMCPICGGTNPLENVTSETVEITSQFCTESFKDSEIKMRKRSIFLILSILLGFTGVHYFYIYRRKAGLFTLIGSIALFSTLLVVLLLIKLKTIFAIFIPLLVVYLINIVISLIFTLTYKFKDGNGNIIR